MDVLQKAAALFGGLRVLATAIYVAVSLAALVLAIRNGRRALPGPVRWLPAVTVLLLLLAGLAASDAHRTATAARMRADLIAETEGIARALAPELVGALSFNASDATNPACARIAGHLRDYAGARGHRAIHTFALRGARLVAGPHSLPADAPAALPPGAPFGRLAAAAWLSATGGVSAVVAPADAGQPAMISAIAPVSDPACRAARMALAIDVDATHWRNRLAAATVLPLVAALLVLSLLLAGQRVLLDQDPLHDRGLLRHAAALVTATLGLLLTTILVWTAHDIEARSRHIAFAQLADAHARSLANTVRDVAGFGVAALARFFESSELVTAAEFRSFASSLPAPECLRSYEWVPRLAGARRAALAAEAARNGVRDFAPWQADARGNRSPVPDRPVLCPVLYSAAGAGMTPTPAGFDRSADPVFVAAAQTAIRSGLPTATLPRGSRPAGSPDPILILRPVRTAQPGSATAPDNSAAGFVIASLLPDPTLQARRDEAASDAAPSVDIEFADLHGTMAADSGSDGPPMAFAPFQRLRTTPPDAVYPLFLDGRTLAIRIRPAPAFLAARPLRDGLGIAVGGSTISVILAFFVGVLAGRERRLGEEVRRRTRELRQSQRRLVRAQRAARMGSWHHHPDGAEPEWSPEILHLFDLDPTGPVTRAAFLDRIHPDDRERVAEAWSAAARGGSHEIEYRTIIGGATRWMSERTESEGESPSAFMGIVQDITDRRALQDQLFQAQRLDTVGRLAGGIAHDFNNLLQVISGFCDLLHSRIRPGEEGSEDLKEIETAALRASELTRQLLAFSRRQVMTPRVLDLNAVIEKNRRMLARVLGEDVRIDLQPGADLDRVRIDPGQFDQIVMNLAVNARDAMSAGGTLTIRTDNLDLSAADARAIPDAVPGRYVRVTVNDTGCGMTPEVRRQIFEPFFTTKGRQGTGLGLSVVYGIVRQQEGFIRVESEPGRGTTFHVCFPACSVVRDPTPLQEPEEDLSAYRGNGQTLLIIEDEPGVLRFLERVLGGAGYSIHGASSHAEAVALATRLGSSMEILVSDVVLPDGTGLDLADQFRARLPRLHVLLVSGHTDERLRMENTIRRGIRFLPKPLSARTILKTLHEMLHP
ncbi:MAG: response regulator [Lentisphaerae bacterium]|nr:response regulator [Lentisphaerota bacterium]